MHELSLAGDILRLVEDAADSERFGRVAHLRLESADCVSPGFALQLGHALRTSTSGFSGVRALFCVKN